MFHRRPLGLTTITSDAGGSIAKLAAVEGFSRAVLVGVVPLIAYEALDSKEAVARTYLMAAFFTLFVTLNFNRLERLLQRRWVVTLGGIFLIGAALLLYFGQGVFFSLGIGMRSAAASIFTVCMSLYIMEYIQKAHFTKTESRRMLFNGAAWLIAPLTGVYLWETVDHIAPFILSATAAGLMILFFWYLRLGDNKILKAAKPRPPTTPLRLLPRYFGQKNLRIAYFITLSRSMFWATLFVYAPIYVVEAGYSKMFAAGLLSAASGLLFLSPLIRRLAERFTTKRVIICGLVVAGSSMLILGLIGSAQPIGIVLWMTASMGGALVDVLGNIPFMRTVKPYERTEMTMVFSTWREMSELMTPLCITLIGLFFPFYMYYFLLAGILLSVSVAATMLPRRL